MDRDSAADDANERDPTAISRGLRADGTPADLAALALQALDRPCEA